MNSKLILFKWTNNDKMYGPIGYILYGLLKLSITIHSLSYGSRFRIDLMFYNWIGFNFSINLPYKLWRQ